MFLLFLEDLIKYQNLAFSPMGHQPFKERRERPAMGTAVYYAGSGKNFPGLSSSEKPPTGGRRRIRAHQRRVGLEKKGKIQTKVPQRGGRAALPDKNDNQDRLLDTRLLVPTAAFSFTQKI
jgi:hypothetical protein